MQLQKQPSADDLNEIWKHLPGVQEEQKQQAEWEEALVRVNRAGAGGTKAGIFGIRPRGMGGSKRLEQMVPTYKKPKRQFEEVLKDPEYSPAAKNARKPDMVLPRSFCPDCNRANRPMEKGAANISHFDKDMPELNLKANQLLASFICQECLEKYRADFKDPAGDLSVAVGDKFYTKREVDRATRMIRIRDNTASYIRAQLHNLRDEADD